MPIITGDGIRMKSWHILLVAAAVVLILVRAIGTSLKRNKERKHRDFSRKLETLLKEKESVKVICPQKDGSAILTNNRLIIEKKGEFQAFPLKNIKKLQGLNAAGNRTTAVKNMVSITVKLDDDHTIRNTCPEFTDLAAQLQQKIKQQKERKKRAEERHNKKQ